MADSEFPCGTIPDAVKGGERHPSGDGEDRAKRLILSVLEPANGRRHCSSAEAFKVSFAEKVAPLTARAITTPACASTAISNPSSMDSVCHPEPSGLRSVSCNLVRNSSAI